MGVVYDYECPHCAWEGEMWQVTYSERGNQSCPICNGRLGFPVMKKAPVMHQPGFQMSAVLSNGEKIKGHFGKDAKREKGAYQKIKRVKRK